MSRQAECISGQLEFEGPMVIEWRHSAAERKVTAVEHCFERMDKLPQTIKWLSDNGSGHTAQEPRRFARDIGLEP